MELKELQYDAGIRDIFRVQGIKSIEDITNLTLEDLKLIIIFKLLKLEEHCMIMDYI